MKHWAQGTEGTVGATGVSSLVQETSVSGSPLLSLHRLPHLPTRGILGMGGGGATLHLSDECLS